jgi:hypothetical protein
VASEAGKGSVFVDRTPHHIELAEISQEICEQFYNPPSAGEICPMSESGQERESSL